ncbi:unnamed protein product [Rotaria magnacalcarata]|uniref:Uncharacterized protein n=1 Tax=Rotaria magnacalcarata TaxID=392030 RepID=A0A816AMI0_9BILA|nr:unnamed protein product [Rotaria magnacalcarata]CAF2132172.1 unnamed protein product [Rotaria magnacalcarata]CAF2144575.1 unnamed protein product [Rotaria magnacalcarata]CAF3852489.1 unnamed protein product [Rotaria magnacalcarata]CAF4018421.1 unnamed protein product [Rotaria magnacalcarata]
MTSTNSTGRKSKRDDPKRSSGSVTVVVGSEQQMTKTKNAVKSNDAVVLTQTSNTINTNNKKRRATEIIQNEVPLSERLSAFESQTSTGPLNSEQKQQSLSADSLVTLLTQGLQSSDAALLDVSKLFLRKIFNRTTKTAINNSHLCFVIIIHRERSRLGKWVTETGMNVLYE